MIRRHLRAIIVALGVLGAVIFLHLLNPDRWSGAADRVFHSLHGPGFGAVATATLLYLRAHMSFPRDYGLAAALAFAAGLLSEAAQIPGPREAQLSDLVVNGLGIIGALGTCLLLDPRARSVLSAKWLLVTGAMGVVSLGYVALPTILFSHAWAAQIRALPDIVTFERPWEHYVFSQPDKVRPHLEPAPESWPIYPSTLSRSREQGQWGIFLSVDPPSDWQGYSKLSFVAATDVDALAVAVGVWDMRPTEDGTDNRFYTRVEVGAEAKRFTIEFDAIAAAMKDRPFDFSHVRSLVFSASNPGSDAELLLDDIRLER